MSTETQAQENKDLQNGEKKQYKVIKNFVKHDEALAKSNAAKKLGIPKKLLKANHTENCFIFERR